MVRKRKFGLLAVAIALGLALTVVAASLGASRASDTLVFAGATDPTLLDPSLVSDGESLRVGTQIFEGLVGLKPGTTETRPSLATSWKGSNKGKTWTFTLRKGVKFHDGTPFNAAAVCANFNRWYNFPEAMQPDSVAYYYFTVFGGYAHPGKDIPGPKDALYKNCRAVNASTAQINLTRASASFIPALTLPSLAMQSPTALKKYEADKGTLTKEGSFRPGGTYATEHPTGTGAFKFVSWKVGDRLVLERYDDYKGVQPKAKLKRIIFRPIGDNAARLQALQTGEIQAYDLVEPQDWATIRNNSKLKLLERPAFNVGYVTINSGTKPTDKLEVRQAVAHGLDRSAVVKSFYPPGAQVAHEFMPPTLFGYAKDVKKYEYSPDKAKALLQKAGLTLPVEIDFWYPTDVARPYMPDPKRNFEAFAASLEKSGFKVNAHSAPWRPDYVSKVQAGTAGNLNLIGWTGDFGDPDNFIGTFFRTKQGQWGPIDPKIHAILNQALAETDADKRTGLYQQANRMIANYVPGVPYVHTKNALGFAKNVTGYVTSPLGVEYFANVRVG